jgi:peptide deformylase
MGFKWREIGNRYFKISRLRIFGTIPAILLLGCCATMYGENEMRPTRILKITRMGDPILAEPAKKVEDPTSPETHRIVEDMVATAIDFGSLAGLAAPQVKIPYRIVLFTVPPEKGEEIPLTVMINPTWEPLSNEMNEDWEGCLSVPGLVGLAPRYTYISYTYQTVKGEVKKVEAKGFHARVVQHECDHLDGKLYLQRMTDMKNLVFVEEFIKYIRPALKAEEKPILKGKSH